MTDNIDQAINKVMKEVGYVQKEYSQKIGYSFAGEAELIAAIRPSMVENGIYMYMAGIPKIDAEIFETKKGTVMNRVSLIAKIKFRHVPSGTEIDVYEAGEGMDAGDKATNKALTAAYKYALRQTFCIETGDDPDKQPSQEQERSSPTPGPARTPPTQRTIQVSPDVVKKKIRAGLKEREYHQCTDKQRGLAAGMLNLCFAGDEDSDNKRHSVLAYLFGVDSMNDVPNAGVLSILDWMKAQKDSGGAYAPDPISALEANAIVAERIRELGQEEIPF